jgi:hypothetical protein
MRKSLLYLIVIFWLAPVSLRGQDISDRLEQLFDRLTENYKDSDRIRINDSIKLILDGYVRSDSVFTHKFTNLRYLGQITSPDSLIKIITWNLVLDDEPGKYNCYFIKKEGSGKENKVYRLSAAYSEKPVSTDTVYSSSDWYGALYYDLKPYKSEDKQCWVLLGIDYGNAEVSRKIIDVLSFPDDDSIVFGSKWFDSGKAVAYRVVFEYASNAMMSLRFKNDNSIIFDHLVPISLSRNNRMYDAPDYSFDAYNFENGKWKLKINVDERKP